MIHEPAIKLFEGEKWLVLTSSIGFILAAGIAIYLFFQGPIILPEGNAKDAFSFNAAIGVFVLSIAAILPFANFRERNRKMMRWFFIITALYAYAVETIQNFRGLNPRFSREGSVFDIIAGILFGVDSLVLVTLALLLPIQFFRLKAPVERPLLILGIRYAVLSVFVANLAGVWMILLQDRFTGDAGNLIVLHGIGFHALQTLIVPGWFLERAQINEKLKKSLIHYGSMAWILSIIVIGIQTGLGKTVFELTALPIFAIILLFIWLGTTIYAGWLFIKRMRKSTLSKQVRSL
ncbi:hypothetical protein [Metabacillus bambusae]|uniref:DUF2306 domain-containing protein n=1 Tax=Metabacillus bambusae TaxID=2795218 RepID=A0ABS3N2D5_9BACI|nr:hypothetical protein [Metabacillus bambusae]MBO1512452.1 hypothetical protein [Metabacillus bambusae]